MDAHLVACQSLAPKPAMSPRPPQNDLGLLLWPQTPPPASLFPVPAPPLCTSAGPQHAPQCKHMGRPHIRRPEEPKDGEEDRQAYFECSFLINLIRNPCSACLCINSVCLKERNTCTKGNIHICGLPRWLNG